MLSFWKRHWKALEALPRGRDWNAVSTEHIWKCFLHYIGSYILLLTLKRMSFFCFTFSVDKRVWVEHIQWFYKMHWLPWDTQLPKVPPGNHVGTKHCNYHFYWQLSWGNIIFLSSTDENIGLFVIRTHFIFKMFNKIETSFLKLCIFSISTVCLVNYKWDNQIR